ncbi:hypothetical protein RHS01_07585 [Rhizoctonia solani]|uniref:Uncharacterized protein n=1 Tax=Rhizoctonia solani TaxID=456999 RepID=A0A8H7I788_9AGAM|nr:hypothetical protein RHS01_07585 [Rhizoctonia solani]
MGLFSKFKRKVQAADDKAVLDLSRSTRLKRDIAAVSNVTIAASMIPSGGVSSLAGIYSVPRFLWTWKKHRIVKKDLAIRGLTVPDRTKRDYIIPATVGAITGMPYHMRKPDLCAQYFPGALGAGADSIDQFSDAIIPSNPDATHEIPVTQWLEQVGNSTVETATNHVQAVFDPEFAQGLTEGDWENAYNPDDLSTHVENGADHLDDAIDTIMSGGLPFLSERTADLAGQTISAVVIGEMAGKGIGAVAPARREVVVSQQQDR